jgi:hypothetical protein
MAALSSKKTSFSRNLCELTLLDCILDAQKAANRAIYTAPLHFSPTPFSAETLTDFGQKHHSGGWVADIYFRDIPAGATKSIETPDAISYERDQDALLTGPRLLCSLLTVSPEVPFMLIGDCLVVTEA